MPEPLRVEPESHPIQPRSLRVEPFGDAAVLVTFGDTIDPLLNRRVHGLARMLDLMPERERPFGFGRSVPAYASLLIPFDPSAVSAQDAAQHLQEVIHGLDPDSSHPAPSQRTVEIPVRYGGHHGPDLPEVGERTGLTPDEVIQAHASTAYTCFFLGFLPGFAYLGVLPPELELPRRSKPRTRVPAGSVAIAGRQTAVYPTATPGGWHLIGRTEAPLWDVRRDPPALLASGDMVRFVPDGG